MRFLPSAIFDSRASTTGVGWGKFGPGMEGWERSEQDFAEQKTKR